MTVRRVGPGVVLVALVAGILTGEHVGASPARLPLAGAVIAAAVALVGAWTRRGGVVGLVVLCVGTLLGGWAATARALDGLRHSELTVLVRERADAIVDATLTTDPDATRFAARALARVRGRIVTVDASGDAAGRLAVLRAGDRVRLGGYFRPLDRFEARARWQHAVGAFAAGDVYAVDPPRSPLMRIANGLRDRVLAGTRGVPEPQRALLAGLLLGDTTDLPPGVVADFRAAGLSHLVAVSGQNVAFVLALAGPLLRRGHRALRLGFGVGVVVVFAAMTRFEPSVLRASVMAACTMTALTVGRPTAGLRSLTLAATLLLLADPFLLHSIGFALSCAASAGIALWSRAIAVRVPGPRPLAEALGVTVAAQLAVAPLLVAVFDGVPLVAVPANLLVAPVAGPLTALGLVGGVVGGVVGGPIAAIVTFPAAACATGVLLVARWAAAVPVVLGPRELVAGLPVLVTGAGVFAVRWVRRATWRGARPRAPQSGLAVPPR